MPATAAATTKIQTAAPSKGSRLGTVASIIGWQILAVLFVELILFWAGLGEEEIFQLDKTLGTRHMTNKRITWRSEGYGQCYLDADGMRESNLTVAKPAGTYRIALLGDSLVEGLQVPFAKTFGQDLDRMLPGATGHRIQVLNFATSGYSTVQEYLQLKQQVLKYKPDMVMLCYNSRDMFENWSPPDQVLSNVRPLAVQLPGQPFLISNGAVTDWMRSPRARFMLQISWIRNHSRIWGVLTAQEMDWSFHNPVYKKIMLFLNDPRKAIRNIGHDLFTQDNAPSFKIKTFEENKPASAPTNTPANMPANTPTNMPANMPDTTENTQRAVQPHFVSAAPNAVLSRTPAVKSSLAAGASNKTYVQLVDSTMNKLLSLFNTTCRQAGSRLVVITMPVRSALCPDKDMETSFFNVSYPQEIRIVKDICQQQKLPFLDLQAKAQTLTPLNCRKLFYSAHYTPSGHQFVAESLLPFILQHMKPQTGGKPAGSSPDQP